MPRSSTSLLERLLNNLVWGLKLLVASLLGLELAYLILGNLFLQLGGLKRLASYDPKTFTMEYASAWTLWPGRGVVRDLELTGQDSVLQWMIRVDRGTVDVELGELFERRFHATRIRGEGTTFRVRFRLGSDEADRPRARALPPIPGHADPPMLPVGPPEPELSDEDYDLWTAHLEDVDAAVREVWIEEYRYTGEIHAMSSLFFFKPLRRVHLAPSRAEVRSGELGFAEHAALAGLEGLLDVALDPFDPRDIEGTSGLGFMTAHAALQAQIPGLSFVRHHLDAPAPEIAGGSGALELDLGLTRGVLTAGSTARVATRDLDVQDRTIGATLTGEAKFRVNEGARGELTTAVERAALRWPGAEAPFAVAENARVSLETPVDLTAAWNLEAHSLDVPSLRIPDLRRVLPEARGGFRVRAGSARLRGKLDRRAGGPIHGAMHADFWRAAVSGHGIAIDGSFDTDLQVDALDLTEKTVNLRGSLGAGSVTVRHGEDVWSDWWTRVRFERVLARAGDVLDVRGEAHAKLRDARPIVGVMAGMDAIPEWATGLFSMDGAEVDVDLDKRGARLSVGVQAISGSQSVTGRLTRRGDEQRGAFLAKSGLLSTGISLEGSSAEVTLLASNEWLKEQLAALRGGAGGASRR